MLCVSLLQFNVASLVLHLTLLGLVVILIALCYSSVGFYLVRCLCELLVLFLVFYLASLCVMVCL
jgi:hypothetical protein